VDRAHERARAKLRLVTQPAFEDVLVAARRSDGEAWQELYGAYAGRVHAYLRAQGAVDAEDLTSEVFLRVYARLDTFSGDEAQFRSWLFTVAHRILIDDVRRNRRRPQPTASPAATSRPRRSGTWVANGWTPSSPRFPARSATSSRCASSRIFPSRTSRSFSGSVREP
jgi:DNA-directed RNA polymerase specialized sigma24 family protein